MKKEEKQPSYSVKAHVEVLGIVEECNTEVIIKSYGSIFGVDTEANKEIYKKFDKGYGVVVKITNIAID